MEEEPADHPLESCLYQLLCPHTLVQSPVLCSCPMSLLWLQNLKCITLPCVNFYSPINSGGKKKHSHLFCIVQRSSAKFFLDWSSVKVILRDINVLYYSNIPTCKLWVTLNRKKNNTIAVFQNQMSLVLLQEIWFVLANSLVFTKKWCTS